MRAKSFVLALTVLVTAGCSAGTAAPATEKDPVEEVKSAPGTTPGSIVVLKNYFFNNYSEHCEDWSLTGTTSDFLTYGECAGNPAYFWLFNDAAQRDKLLPEILKKDMPLLVSDEWVIAADMDLKPAQEDIGGAINP